MTSSVGGKFVQIEALGPELIHGGVYMEQHTTETVVLVWVTLLPEEDVGEFQRSAEFHGLQIVHIVIRVPMDQVELLSPEIFYQPRDVTIVVALLVVL